VSAGAGVAKAQFVPNRGILLLLYMDCVVVYDRDLGTVLERIPLPRRFRAFKKWLLVEGRGQCLGCEEESTLSTFVIEHEVRSLTLLLFMRVVLATGAVELCSPRKPFAIITFLQSNVMCLAIRCSG
jgi:hypothetical protein